MKVRGQLVGVRFPFHHMGPGAGPQVVRFGSLYLLTCSASTMNQIFFIPERNPLSLTTTFCISLHQVMGIVPVSVSSHGDWIRNKHAATLVVSRLSSFWYVPGRGIARSLGSSVCSFLRNCPAHFLRGCTSFHSQQHRRLPLPSRACQLLL